ncbi:hypothetical protein EF912_06165 [Streptomyces sp. WAC07061]|nr:hypothetical protein EF912_06165 [Streptomyces sp. WAC07061]
MTCVAKPTVPERAAVVPVLVKVTVTRSHQREDAAARTGAPAAEPVSRLAAALRADRSRRAGARAQRAAVLVTAPVGLCFLPAFLAVGVAPVVIGMASGLLSQR